LFKPEYAEPNNDDMVIEKWIKEEDILNNNTNFV